MRSAPLTSVSPELVSVPPHTRVTHSHAMPGSPTTTTTPPPTHARVHTCAPYQHGYFVHRRARCGMLERARVIFTESAPPVRAHVFVCMRCSRRCGLTFVSVCAVAASVGPRVCVCMRCCRRCGSTCGPSACTAGAVVRTCVSVCASERDGWVPIQGGSHHEPARAVPLIFFFCVALSLSFSRL